MTVKEELIRERDNKKTSFFWGKAISWLSVFQGLFFLYQADYMTEALDLYFLGVRQQVFGLALLLFGVIKLLGLFLKIENCRIIGIVGLAGVWTMLFTVSFLWSFGVGYPSNMFLSYGFILVACLRVAYKGVFND